MIKKFLALSLVVAACYACNNNETKSAAGADSAAGKTADAPAAAADPSSNPDYQKGLALISASDCLTCHKVDETSTGPAYRDVANKYTANEATIDTLAGKIIAGGSGNWGSVPMTAHPALSKEDAKQMVKYVLLLRNK
ncbi:MAG TPA: c-type cytochrome [Chitinophagaceae bacterium]|jgi:cytochrome c|nr:c-type cytochrome [Chitinophagaceae bacterium]